eukprot:5852913-Pleurochrysis_carterae.AAC.1
MGGEGDISGLGIAACVKMGVSSDSRARMRAAPVLARASAIESSRAGAQRAMRQQSTLSAAAARLSQPRQVRTTLQAKASSALRNGRACMESKRRLTRERAKRASRA